MKITEIDYGVAFTDGKTIEVNKDLKEDPILYDAVIEHEKQHTKDKLIDFWHDFKPNWYDGRLLKWSLRHPRSWASMLPVIIDKKGIAVNYYMVIYWLTLLSLIGVIINKMFI